MTENKSWNSIDWFRINLIGNSLVEASARILLRSDGHWSIRAVKINGSNLILTRDFNRYRVNVSMVDNKITEIISIG